MKLEINYKKYEKHKHVEAKQLTTKQPMDQWRSQRENFKKHIETNENKNIMIQNVWL